MFGLLPQTLRVTLLALLLFPIFITPAEGKILVLEQENLNGTNSKPDHDKQVAAVACPSDDNECEIRKFFTPQPGAFKAALPLNLRDYTSVNMSFEMRKLNESPRVKPWESYTDARDKAIQTNQILRKEITFLANLIRENPETFFVAAAGNGVPLKYGSTDGVVVDQGPNQVHPASFLADNLLKVAALNQTPEEFLQDPESARLPSYSNFGLTYVDIAAPIPIIHPGKPAPTGTSFAAPYVARLVDEISLRYPFFKALEVKEILMKSCYVKNLEAAIVATQDLHVNGENSIVYNAMHAELRKDRDEFLKQSGDIILVRSGGPVIEKVALTCAHYYSENLETESVETSCLRARRDILNENQKTQNLLKTFWQLRRIGEPTSETILSASM